MDPIACLDEIRRLVHEINTARDLDLPVDESDAYALAEHIEALDEWILNGGALPDAWQR